MCTFVPLHVCLKNKKQHNGSDIADKVLHSAYAVRNKVSAIILLKISMGWDLDKHNQKFEMLEAVWK